MKKFFTKWHFTKRDILTCFKIIKVIFKKYISDYCFLKAASLSFTSLFALIPILTIIFSIFPAFKIFDDFRESSLNFIFQNILVSPSLETTEQIKNIIVKFTENTKALGAIGIVFLLLTTLSLFKVIELTFNNIWKSRKNSSFIVRIALFWTMFTWIPFFFAISQYIMTHIKDYNIIRFFPIVFTWSGFFLLIKFIPDLKVRTLPALTGAVITGLLWEISKTIFTFFITSLPAYNIIYSSLAAIPMILTWIYITWCIVLFGVVCTSVFHYGEYILEKDNIQLPSQTYFILKLFLMTKILTNFMIYHRSTAKKDILAICGKYGQQAACILDELEKQGVIQFNRLENHYITLYGVHGLNLKDLIFIKNSNPFSIPEIEDPLIKNISLITDGLVKEIQESMEKIQIINIIYSNK